MNVFVARGKCHVQYTILGKFYTLHEMTSVRFSYSNYQVFSIQHECALAVPNNEIENIPQKEKYLVQNCTINNVFISFLNNNFIFTVKFFIYSVACCTKALYIYKYIPINTYPIT